MNHPIGKPLRYLSVCSGMEAASVAWHPLGWTPVGFSEIEPFPCAILKHRFPNVPNYGSLTEYQSWPVEPGAIDLLVGGTPCQSFSVAGLRKGLADPRGNLALTFLGLADRLKPKWIVWENVPGVLSSAGGRDFGSFLGALVELGYGFAYRVLDAQHFGVPQRRRRVFVVACLGDWRAPAEVLSLRESLRGYLEAGGKKRKGPAADAGSGVEAGGPVVIDRAAFNQGVNAQYEPHIEESEVMDSLVARGPHAVGQPIPIQDGREMEKNQNGMGVGNPGDPAYTIDTTGAQAAGIPFRKSKRAASTTDNETWVPADVTNTLNNFDLGDTRTTHAVVEPIAFSAKDHGGDATVGISPTLRSQNSVEGNQNSSWSIAIAEPVTHTMPGSVAPTVTSSDPPYSRTGNERVEAEALAITFQPGNLRREAGAEPSTTTTTTLKASAGDQTPHVAIIQASELRLSGKITQQTTSPTLLAQTKSGDNEPLAIHPVVPLDGMNLLSRLGECGEEHSMQNFQDGDPSFTLRKGGVQHGVLTLMAVRRLTPVECERLQGFPDNWSRIPWKGKSEEECPDGPRYKACGNSMAVPVMRWIGERIHNYELSQNHEAK